MTRRDRAIIICPVFETLTVTTSRRTDFVDVTREVAAAIKRSRTQSGVCTVLVPHTTAAVTINENADPSVRRDLDTILTRLVPNRADYAHDEGNSDAHAKAALVGNSVTVLVEDGEPVLGTWQGVYFCEFDGPRTRKLFVKVTAG